MVPSDANHAFLYVANATNGTVSTFSIASGKSTRVATATVPSFATPTAIASTPPQNFLYLATSDGSIYLNTIDGNGILKPGNNGNPVATVSQPIWMSMDRTGEWLFVASASARRMQEFRVDAATGELQLSTQTIALDAGTPAEIYLTPDNQRLFVALGKGGVDEFSFDAATGALGNRHHIATLHRGISADIALVSDDESKDLFVAESNSGIRAFAILPGEPVQEIAGSPFGPSQAAPNAVAVDSSRSNLYVTAGDSGASRTLTRYSISGDGSLTPISTTPFSADSFPAATRLDGSGNYLLSISKNAVPVLSPISTQ
ncbi:MAG: lactonase family protein [Acidobacteriaceae bacterium]